MIKKLKNILLSAFAVSLLAAPALVPAIASADAIGENLCAGANLSVTDTCNSSADTASGDKLNDIIKLVINIFSMVVGIIAVIMIIVGGLKYITSSGDSGNVTSAKNTILYAIIGLVIVALAQIIVKFVLNKAVSSTP